MGQERQRGVGSTGDETRRGAGARWRAAREETGRRARQMWERVSGGGVPLAIGVTLALVWLVDLVTRTDLAISIFYDVPIALTLWLPVRGRIGRPTGIVLALALGATLAEVLFGADAHWAPSLVPHLAGDPVAWGNRALGAITQLVVAWVVVRQRRARAVEQELVGKLDAALRTADEFIGIASHELKTPLTGARGHAQLLLRRARRGQLPGLDRRGSEALALIDDLLTRLNLLLDDLLHVSRVRNGQVPVLLERLDVAGLARRAARDLGRQAQEHTLVVTPEAGSIYAAGDARRIEQVLVNLLSNAVKYSPQGGRVEVSVSLAAHEPTAAPGDADGVPAGAAQRAQRTQRTGRVMRALRLAGQRVWRRMRRRGQGAGNALPVAARAGASEVIVRVRDEGMGIPPAERANLFGRFMRASNAASSPIPGTGLGLYLCRTLVEAHGGRIWLDRSEEGQGSTFAFSLPVWEEVRFGSTTQGGTRDEARDGPDQERDQERGQDPDAEAAGGWHSAPLTRSALPAAAR